MASTTKKIWICACDVKNEGHVRECTNCGLEKHRALGILPTIETVEEYVQAPVASVQFTEQPPLSPNINVHVQKEPPQIYRAAPPPAHAPVYAPPPAPVHIHNHAEKKRGGSVIGVIFIILIIGVAGLLALSAFDVFCIGETLGITAPCRMAPLCRNNSTLFSDLCSRCAGVVDGIFNHFNR
ncbi:MAG: hypothetical protein FWE90_12460 [Defluviitaleaceae bacterium]|nr:hypothetical protein [Defluviitaleaceae bacterium]